MRSIAAFLIACLFSVAAQAQVAPGSGVNQYGTVTSGHITTWKGPGLIQDGGSPASGVVTGGPFTSGDVITGGGGQTITDSGTKFGAAVQRHDPTGVTATFAQITQYFKFYCGLSPGSCFLSNDVFNEALVAHAGDLNANTCFASPDGNDSTGTGAYATPYLTVDKCVRTSAPSFVWLFPGDYAAANATGYRSSDTGSGALKALQCLGPPGSCVIRVPGTYLATAAWANGVAATTPAAAAILTCSTHTTTTVDTCTETGNSCPTNSIIVGQKMTDVSGDIGAAVTVSSITSCTAYVLSSGASGSHAGDAITFIGGTAGVWTATVNAFPGRVLDLTPRLSITGDFPFSIPRSIRQCASLTIEAATANPCWYYTPSEALLSVTMGSATYASVAAYANNLRAIYFNTSTTSATAQHYLLFDAKLAIRGVEFDGVYVDVGNSSTGSELWATDIRIGWASDHGILNESSVHYLQRTYIWGSNADNIGYKLAGGNQVPIGLEADVISEYAGDISNFLDPSQAPLSGAWNINASSADNGNVVRVNGKYRFSSGPDIVDAIYSWNMGVTSGGALYDGGYANSNLNYGIAAVSNGAIQFVDTSQGAGNFPLYISGTGAIQHIFNSSGVCTAASGGTCDTAWSPP